jgi:NAD(P)-dependent dehydrogenase (short-subunit alcohol dehydrogenase family)
MDSGMTSTESTQRNDSPLPPAAAPLKGQDFRGRVAVVTGGGTGLGLEISRGLAALGAHVWIASRSAEHHQTFVDECARRGWNGTARVLDVRETAQVAALARDVEQQHGRCDILVNNAAGNFVCPAERLSERAWRAVLGIVLDGSFYCSRDFGRVMIDHGGGQILNVLATYAWTGMPGVLHSACAKAGVLAMTRTLAVEWARHGIRVNAIAPGPFESDGARANLWPDEEHAAQLRERIPLRRFATTAEVAAQCLWLLSPASAYVNGECLTIDAGASLGQGMWDAGTSIRRQRHADASEERGASPR